MKKARKMKIGRGIVHHKTMKKFIKLFYCSIVPLLSPVVLLLTSKVGQNLKKNVFKSSKTYSFSRKCYRKLLKYVFLGAKNKI